MATSAECTVLGPVLRSLYHCRCNHAFFLGLSPLCGVWTVALIYTVAVCKQVMILSPALDSPACPADIQPQDDEQDV